MSMRTTGLRAAHQPAEAGQVSGADAPLMGAPETFGFPRAAALADAGAAVTRLAWPAEQSRRVIAAGKPELGQPRQLFLWWRTGSYDPWPGTIEDFVATDWTVAPEPNPIARLRR